MIFLGADHGGFELKDKIKQHLDKLGVPYEDLGAYSSEPVDYPDYAFAVADRVVAQGGQARGILACTTSVGVCMAANKVRGIRAAVGYGEAAVSRARNDEDANVICLAGQDADFDEALRMIDLFLGTPFSNAERHVRRLGKISERERRRVA
ncbi:MAG: RpiB/LacA/LacB family sugar-phosphate isomerase [Actinobacteria bacterium]|nr:RpiB/LacA/LacB family sugar-phosphate isomerase [Actinomycetota bacterium]